mmetsp:Transcript_22489/g.44549  ORF Transcript_22489/g.44549 Transcript_22489/m.44549 type:complete len:122 (-) Transcript_22489:944-1309(-)
MHTQYPNRCSQITVNTMHEEKGALDKPHGRKEPTDNGNIGCKCKCRHVSTSPPDLLFDRRVSCECFAACALCGEKKRKKLKEKTTARRKRHASRTLKKFEKDGSICLFNIVDWTLCSSGLS